MEAQVALVEYPAVDPRADEGLAVGTQCRGGGAAPRLGRGEVDVVVVDRRLVAAEGPRDERLVALGDDPELVGVGRDREVDVEVALVDPHPGPDGRQRGPARHVARLRVDGRVFDRRVLDPLPRLRVDHLAVDGQRGLQGEDDVLLGRFHALLEDAEIALAVGVDDQLVVGGVVPSEAAVAVGEEEDPEEAVPPPGVDVHEGPLDRLAVGVDHPAGERAGAAEPDLDLGDGLADLDAPLARGVAPGLATR